MNDYLLMLIVNNWLHDLYEALQSLIAQAAPHAQLLAHHVHKVETWMATATLVLATVFRCISPLGIAIAVIVLLTAYLQHH